MVPQKFTYFCSVKKLITMKKTLIMSLVVGSLFFSCSSEREFDTEANYKSNAKISAKGRESVCDFFENSTASTVIPGIKAVNLDTVSLLHAKTTS